MNFLVGAAFGQGAAPQAEAEFNAQAQQLNAQAQRLWGVDDLAGAARIYAQMLALCDLVVPASIPFCHISARTGRGQIHMRLKEWSLAEAEFRLAADIARTRLPPDNPRIGSSAALLGSVLIMGGRAPEAEPWFRAALPFAQPGEGSNALNRGFLLNSLALSLVAQNRFPEATEVAAQAIEALRPRQDTPGKDWLRRALLTRGIAERMLKRLGTAEAALMEYLAVAEAANDRTSLGLAEALHQLGILRMDQERPADAEKPFRDALAIREPLLGERHNDVASTLLGLGKVALMATRYPEAEALLLRAQAIYEDLGQANGLGGVAARDLLAALRAASAGVGQAATGPDTDNRAAREARALRLDYDITEDMRQGRGEQAVAALHERIQLLTALHGATANITITARIKRANQLQGLARLAEAEAEITTALNDLGQQRIPVTRGQIHNSIALIRWDQGRLPEAESQLRYALALPFNAERDPETAGIVNVLLSNLGAIVRRLGRYPEAIALGERALAGERQAYGEEHVQTAGTMHLLGNTYGLAQRDAEAAAMRRRALDIRLKLLGERNYVTIINLQTVAGDRMAQGDLAGAEDLINRARAAAEAMHGPDHVRTGEVLGTLADLRRAQGRYAEAGQLQEKTIAIARKTFGDNHPSVIGGQGAMATLFHTTGHLVEAERLYRQALTTSLAQNGAQHPAVAGHQASLAYVLIDRGMLVEAKQLLTTSMAILTAVHGSESPALTNNLLGLARLARHESNYDLAAIMTARAVGLLDKAGMGDRPGTAFARAHLADALLALGKVADAAAAITQAREILTNTQIADTPRMINVLRTAALVALAEKHPESAGPDLDRALELSRRFLGGNGGAFGAMLNDRGLAAARQTQHVEAIGFYKDAVAVMDKAGLGKHLYMAITLRNLAASLDLLMRKPEAQRARERAQGILRNYIFITKPPDRWT